MSIEHSSSRENPLSRIAVTSISDQELLALALYLEQSHININQRLLQDGIVSAGYKAAGVKALENGLIGFDINSNGQIIYGTPAEFSEQYKKVPALLIKFLKQKYKK